MKSNDAKKAEFLRRHGLYATDILRWFFQYEEEGVKALCQRKVRKDKKSEEQIKIERLEAELHRQEKTTAKLSSLVLIQKKSLRYSRKTRINITTEEKVAIVNGYFEAQEQSITIIEYATGKLKGVHFLLIWGGPE